MNSNLKVRALVIVGIILVCVYGIIGLRSEEHTSELQSH